MLAFPCASMQVLDRSSPGRVRRVLGRLFVPESNLEDARLFRDDKGTIRQVNR